MLWKKISLEQPTVQSSGIGTSSGLHTDKKNRNMQDKNFLEQPTVPSFGESRYLTFLWVSGNVKPQEQLCQFDPSQSTTIGFKLRDALKLLSFRQQHVIVQFWSPRFVNKHQQLTTIDQPFGLGIPSEKLLCYRRESEQKVFLVDKDHEEEDNPPVRVFRRGMPEWTCDLTNYKTKDFPQQDCAIRCNLHGYLALPVFDYTTELCVGVLELLTSSVLKDVAYEVEQINRVLKKRNLTSPQTYEVFDGPALNVSNERRRNEMDEIYAILKLVCDSCALPLAQTWVLSPYTTYSAHEELIDRSCSSFNTRCFGKACMSTTLPYCARDLWMWPLMQASRKCHLEKSRGVVGRAFSSRGSCYCQDVTELSEEEYPLVHYARMSRLTSCFAIFLRSVEGNNEYVLEFFLPLDIEDSRHVLNLVQTLRQHIKAASGFELGNVSFIEMVGPPTDIDMSVNEMDSSDLESVVSDTSETDYANRVDQWSSASTNTSLEMICDNFTDSIEKSNLLTVNVTFNTSMEQFIFPLFDGLPKLESEVAKWFSLEGQGFRLKYIDENGDLIVICCDDDLNLALDTLGSNTINLTYGKASF